MHRDDGFSIYVSGLISVFWMCLAACAVAADLVPLEHFAKLPEYRQPKISPGGEYAAAIAPVADQDSLVIIRLKDTTIESALQFERGAEVIDFYWVNDDRVVCTFSTEVPGEGAILRSTREIIAMDASGKNKKLIFGLRSGLDSRVDSRIKEAKPINAAGYVIDPLHADRTNVLVASYPYVGRIVADVAPTIYKVHVYNGARKRQNPVPFQSFNYLTDQIGEIRAVNIVNEDSAISVLYRDANEPEFSVMESLSAPNADVTLLAMNAAGGGIYVADSQGGKPRGLSLFDPRTGSMDHLWSDDTYDVSGLVWSADSSTVIGVTYYADRLRYAFLDERHPDSRLIMSVQKAFSGKEVEIVSRTADGTVSIIRVGSASEPSDYYLFDSEQRNMSLLLGSRSWIDPTRMSPAEHFEIDARDGQKLRGYLTIPVDGGGKNLPLVVMPHAGPDGIRDTFEFDPDVQVLASRGYAVLQVNFRGSGGYGPAFQEAGYRRWGSVIQDDIADATRWAVGAGHADPNRVCIAGSGFGGYSSVMSAVKYPDLYKCAVGEFGVYDLPLMYKEGDIADKDTDVDYLKMAIGTDEAELIGQSPSRNVGSIKADLFIIYGTSDDKAPPTQSLSLIRALDEAGKRYEVFEMPEEGHSSVGEPTRLERYSRILAFLEKNIGNPAMLH